MHVEFLSTETGTNTAAIKIKPWKLLKMAEHPISAVSSNSCIFGIPEIIEASISPHNMSDC
jgi:hypothetical protein